MMSKDSTETNMPEEEKISPYFPNTKDIGRTTEDGHTVYGGALDLAGIPKALLTVYKKVHADGKCPGCEETFVCGAVAAFESLGFPRHLVQEIIRGWEISIRADPPTFLDKLK